MKSAFRKHCWLLALWLPVAAAQEAQRYFVVASESELRILVFRGGPLGSFGHNHVVSAGAVRGEVDYIADAPAKSTFELHIPVREMVVDDPQQRRVAGPGFANNPGPEAVRDTRANMLGPKVLDVSSYPEVEVRSLAVHGRLPELTVRVLVRLRGAEQELDVPVYVRHDDDRLRAHGSLRFAQSTFGIEPFRILLGAVAVRDQLEVEFDLTARASAP